MTFVSVRPLTTTSIVATATTAVDMNSVQYLFTNETTGASSGWQSSAVWTNVVPADSVNAYRVKAKDSVGNESLWSFAFTQSPFTYNVMTTGGDWATGSNWSLGAMPSGPQTAVINTNIVATSGSASSYTGDLILREGAEINMGIANLPSFFPIGPASQVHVYDGSLIEVRQGDINIPIVLHGDLTIQKQNQGSSLNVKGLISGSGHLTYQDAYYSGRELKVNNTLASTYTGGTTMEPHPDVPTLTGQLLVYANEAFGTGDVTINGGTLGFMLLLMGTTTDVIDDSATLSLVGYAKLDLSDDSETVGKLFIDGKPQLKGTWGSSSSPAGNPDDSHFLGTGVLTVLDTDVPPPGSVIVVR